MSIDSSLVEVLKRWKQTTQFSAQEDWIFASPVLLGRLPWSYPWVLRVFGKAASDAGIAHVSTHTMRHTHRSWLDAVGTPVAVQQKLMRHADIRTTMNTTRGYPWSDEVDTFWDWALLELLVQSGLRIEEASELTTFDILKRKMPDSRIYYLLHIKPSKFDRARVIPIGDGLGRVLAEIIRYVKRFYNSESVPVCDHWDLQEKRPRPPAPYLIQGIRHPSTAGIQTIRSRIREISIAAEGRRSDGSALVLLPHDCRRVFASEHLNNNTPVHIIQALLGHASPDTVMIYAKLYPSQLIEEYRKTVRNLYNAYYGGDGLKNPTVEEWGAFTANCNLRDMGTHLCALPTGEHCPKGLICLGCAHAQPKKSAVPIFRRMLASHERSLVAARGHSEPAGQIASREMEIVRIKGALQRAEELSDDVAAAIERTL